ncbi:hypothetical protein SNEBB_008787 [Seison nebaliae]|nr:hypothetical protein SNEBB_008787 [Seison nebaliae]
MSSKKSNDYWIKAVHNPVANVRTTSYCITTANVLQDNEHKLILADLSGWLDKNTEMEKPNTSTITPMYIRVYQSTTIVKEIKINYLPSGIVSVKIDDTETSQEALFVAAGSSLYVFKGMKPFFKFNLPTRKPTNTEKQIWDDYREKRIDLQSFYDRITNYREANTNGDITLSAKYLIRQPFERWSHILQPLNDPTTKPDTSQLTGVIETPRTIVCISTIPKKSSDKDAVRHIIIGTECRNVYVMEVKSYTIIYTLHLPTGKFEDSAHSEDYGAIPIIIVASGIFEVEYRLAIACRNNFVYLFKRGSNEVVDRIFLENTTAIIGMVAIHKSLLIGTANQQLSAYTMKGKRLWRIDFTHSITSMVPMYYHPKNLRAALVAFSNGEVHGYKEKFPMFKFRLANENSTTDNDDNERSAFLVNAMHFGRFGREDGALTMITDNRHMFTYILKRNVEFATRDEHAGPPPSQKLPLDIPKKTVLFKEQQSKEKIQYKEIYKQYQYDLIKLKFLIGETYLNSLKKSLTPIVSTRNEQIKLNAHAVGMGPLFKVYISIQNTTHDGRPAIDLYLLLDSRSYRFNTSIITIPFLMPSLTYEFNVDVEYGNTSNNFATSGDISISLNKNEQETPLIVATLTMPMSECDE